MPIEITPTYNLKVVVQETGVKPDTLRAWERRYGLPKPQRTLGKQRLYSHDDIETIKWLLARQEEGLSISRSVKLWQTMTAAGENPLQVHGDDAALLSTMPSTVLSSTTMTDIRTAWLQACIAFDETAAEQVLTQAFAVYPPLVVCLEVLQKGLSMMGELWYQNEVTAQQEHFASALAMRRLNALVAAMPAPTRSARIIVGCPAQEEHVFAPLLLTLMLRYNGWHVVYLGANVPLTRLETVLASVHPSLIIMTAQQLHSAAHLMDVADFLNKENVPLAFGGRIFNALPQIRSRVPGYFLGECLESTVKSVSHILLGGQSLPAEERVSETYHQALIHYQQQQAAIESHVWQLLRPKNAVYTHIANANLHLSRDMTAALRLGDITLLGTEITWIQKLLLNYGMPANVLPQYLTAYCQAAKANLGEEGQLIVGWLKGICDVPVKRISHDHE